ncbi:MAG TPA: bifunctional glycosyltransferase/class I SAM-dependent methyltransferase [Acidimicrobiales bacterium]|nr:bifunctional glycosyltransferase/class I SAM-dependent methyltransferase [Acidimicrobiales bacterium]
MKVGVLVVAYNAESTLSWVLDRIPDEVRGELTEILIQDDFSSDNTEAVARAYDAFDDIPITVVRHARNLGYGGNQKAGYQYAMDHGWDVVVLLHGDGQYAPERIGDMIAPLVAGEADAVFGSRMLERGAALAGNMPLYKFVGNKVLSSAQNWLAGIELSEWHSGYRAYRVDVLRELPLTANSDGFDFDTEIILQLIGAGKRIVEVPTPTFYGDEICHVQGVSYARAIMADTLRYRLGQAGFGRGKTGGQAEPYSYKPSPNSSHAILLGMIDDAEPKRILDVGCGPAWVADELRRRGHSVVGVDGVAYDGVRDRVDEFHQADLEDGLPAEIGGEFDLVIAGDIIEHVRWPDRLMDELATRLANDGEMLASVPNFAHWYPRARVSLGLFDYDQRGILDRTHLRHFTRRSFRRLVKESSLELVELRYSGLPLGAVGLSGLGPRIVQGLDRRLVRTWPTMFAYQLIGRLRFAAENVTDPA